MACEERVEDEEEEEEEEEEKEEALADISDPSTDRNEGVRLPIASVRNFWGDVMEGVKLSWSHSSSSSSSTAFESSRRSASEMRRFASFPSSARERPRPVASIPGAVLPLPSPSVALLLPGRQSTSKCSLREASAASRAF